MYRCEDEDHRGADPGSVYVIQGTHPAATNLLGPERERLVLDINPRYMRGWIPPLQKENDLGGRSSLTGGHMNMSPPGLTRPTGW